MSNELNKFLADLKTVLTAGFTVGSRQFFGTSGGGILQVKDYTGTLKPFLIEYNKKNLGVDMFVAPYVYIRGFTTNNSDVIGSGGAKIYNLEVFLVYSQEYCKAVDGTDISEDELARYFLDEFNTGMKHVRAHLAGTKATIEQLPGTPQNFTLNETNVYGFGQRYKVTLR